MNEDKYYKTVRTVRKIDDAENLTFWDYMKHKDETQSVLNEIPKAVLFDISHVNTAEGIVQLRNPQKIKAVVLEENEGKRIVATVSRHYKLVQHKTAFEPIFKALHDTGTDYSFALFQTDTKAFVKVFVDEIGDNGSGIKLGFEAMNSIDGRGAINYTLMSSEIKRQTTRTIEVVGLRLACKNGMKVRVPLDQAEEIKIEIRTEVQEKVRELLKMATNIIHMGENIEEKTKAVQYVVEAMTLLKEPIAQIIKNAKEKQIGEQDAKFLIGKYIGKRLSEKIYEQFQNEDQTIWGLYNAITYVASHGDVKESTMNGLLNKSADLLEEEITINRKVKVKA